MHCKTSAICSASGDSESQIRPTLTTKTTENVYIHTFVNYYWHNHKLVVIGDSDYLMQQWTPFPFLPFFVTKTVIQLFIMPQSYLTDSNIGKILYKLL